MNDVSALDWQEIVGLDLYEAACAYGTWSIMITGATASIRFEPPLTKGKEYEAASARLAAMKERRHDADAQRLANSIGRGYRDVGHAETVTEAILLVDALHARRTYDKSPESRLEEAGFTRPHPDHGTMSGLWRLRIRSGSYDVHVKNDEWNRSVVVVYQGDGARCWHNVFGIWGRRFSNAGDFTMLFQLPEGLDVVTIGVAHALTLMHLREDRAGKRFSTPIGRRIR